MIEMSISKELMKILACPKCKSNVNEKGMFIVCSRCALAYPILDGNVPDMLIDDAWELKKAEKAMFKHGLKL